MKRDSTLHSCFIVSDLASASKRSLFPSRRDFATFAGLQNPKKGSLLPKSDDVLRKIHLRRKMGLHSTYSGFRTLRQVSLYLSGLEMNWASSFLVRTCDRSALVPRSCRYSGEASRARSRSSSKSDSGASRCSPLSHRLMS